MWNISCAPLNNININNNDNNNLPIINNGSRDSCDSSYNIIRNNDRHITNTHQYDYYHNHQWWFLFLSVVPLGTLFGNSLVILAVITQRNLRNISNRVIASLALTDFLLALFVVPFGIYQLVSGEWELGFNLCVVWTGSDVILSTASIMHLCSIALYRYHGIAHPFRGRKRNRVSYLIVPAWMVSIALSIPFIIQAFLDPSNVLERSETEHDGSKFQCGIYNRTFATYSSLVSFFIPLIVMSIVDILSVQTLRRQAHVPKTAAFSSNISSSPDRITLENSTTDEHEAVYKKRHDYRDFQQSFKKKSFSSFRSKALNRSEPCSCSYARTCDETRSLPLKRSSNVQNSFVKYQARGDRCTLQWRDSCNHRSPLKPCSTHRNKHFHSSFKQTNRQHCPTTRGGCCSEHRCGSEDNYKNNDQLQQHYDKTQEQFDNDQQRREMSPPPRPRSKSLIYLDMLASGGSFKINGRERRAEKTLIWVFAVFVVLWLPFFCTNLIYGVCSPSTCNVPPALFQTFAWLGYLSSGVNPCIYTLLNRDFRTAFHRILTCKRHYHHARRAVLTSHASLKTPCRSDNNTIRGGPLPLDDCSSNASSAPQRRWQIQN